MCTAHGYLLGMVRQEHNFWLISLNVDHDDINLHQPLLVRRLKESLPVFGSGRLSLRTKLEMNSRSHLNIRISNETKTMVNNRYGDRSRQIQFDDGQLRQNNVISLIINLISLIEYLSGSRL